MVDLVVTVGAFLLGVVIVVWSTDRLLAGVIGLASLLRLAPFAVAGIFSGLEAENVAVGLVAAHGGVPEEVIRQAVPAREDVSMSAPATWSGPFSTSCSSTWA